MVPSFAVFQLLLLIGFLSSGSESLRFDLHPPLTDDRKLVVRVTSTTGNTFHYSDKVESGQFAFVAGEGGDFMTCFWVPDHKPQVTLTVDFDWRTGVAASNGPVLLRRAMSKLWNLSCRSCLKLPILFKKRCIISVKGRKKCKI
ncbi:Transmembrane emp24 domain-containing protein p24delta9, partial [Cucurbita argyrosperma subsp. sororia]